jgi:hypothetical protein
MGTRCFVLSTVVSPLGHATYARPWLTLMTKPSMRSGPISVWTRLTLDRGSISQWEGESTLLNKASTGNSFLSGYIGLDARSFALLHRTIKIEQRPLEYRQSAWIQYAAMQ